MESSLELFLCPFRNVAVKFRQIGETLEKMHHQVQLRMCLWANLNFKFVSVFTIPLRACRAGFIFFYPDRKKGDAHHKNPRLQNRNHDSNRKASEYKSLIFPRGFVEQQADLFP
jgi:hypothetical protein